MAAKKTPPNRYLQLIEKIFFDRYTKAAVEFTFPRTDMEDAAKDLEIQLPKNLGDVIYAIRYRIGLPAKIKKTQPKGMEWIIQGAGRAMYEFKLVKVNRILPNPNLIAIKIPDATPEIITAYSLSDEQALLAKVRYNRLIDIFLGSKALAKSRSMKSTSASTATVANTLFRFKPKAAPINFQSSKPSRTSIAARKNSQV